MELINSLGIKFILNREVLTCEIIVPICSSPCYLDFIIFQLKFIIYISIEQPRV